MPFDGVECWEHIDLRPSEQRSYYEDLLDRFPFLQFPRQKTDSYRYFTENGCFEYYRHGTLYSSWLNQIEIWFSKIQRDLIARGIFCSVKDLDRKIMRYIRSYNRKATPIKWSYKDASNRVKTALELNETVH